VVLVYIVCRDREEGRRIGRSLVDERLAACVNMFPIESIYWWQGQVVEDAEFVVVAKTRDENCAAVESHIKNMHSYEVPAIIRIPVAGAESHYLAWLEAETKPSGQD